MMSSKCARIYSFSLFLVASACFDRRVFGFSLPSVLTGSRVRPFTDNQNTRERETDEILSLAQAARDVVLII